MNRYILHRKSKGKEHIKYLIAGAACLIMAGAVGYTAHSIGTCLLYTSDAADEL